MLLIQHSVAQRVGPGRALVWWSKSRYLEQIKAPSTDLEFVFLGKRGFTTVMAPANESCRDCFRSDPTPKRRPGPMSGTDTANQ